MLEQCRVEASQSLVVPLLREDVRREPVECRGEGVRRWDCRLTIMALCGTAIAGGFGALQEAHPADQLSRLQDQRRTKVALARLISRKLSPLSSSRTPARRFAVEAGEPYDAAVGRSTDRP